MPEANIAEEYTPFGHSDYQTIVGKVKDFAKGGDACVLSTINGDSNVPFYKEFANQGLTADKCPIMAFSVAEDELRSMEVPPLVGHLACWNYFQSIDTPENKKFVAGLQGLLRGEQAARRCRPRDRRSDRSRLLRRLRLEGSGGEGRQLRHRQGPRRGVRHEVRRSGRQRRRWTR